MHRSLTAQPLCPAYNCKVRGRGARCVVCTKARDAFNALLIPRQLSYFLLEFLSNFYSVLPADALSSIRHLNKPKITPPATNKIKSFICPPEGEEGYLQHCLHSKTSMWTSLVTLQTKYRYAKRTKSGQNVNFRR